MRAGRCITLAVEDHVLALGCRGNNDREIDRVKHQVPSAEVVILPAVRHRNDVVSVHLLPECVASMPALPRRGRHGRIAFQPLDYRIKVKLLGPEKSASVRRWIIAVSPGKPGVSAS